MRMNRTEIIKVVSNRVDGATQKDVKVIVDTLFDVITETVATGEPVKIAGFGNFEVVERSERKGRNPQTNAEIVIPATKAPKFKPSTSFKDAVKA